jgi:hypothetical protein
MQGLQEFVDAMNSGASAPTVEPSDLKRMREILLEVKARSGDGQIGILVDGLEPEFSPGANLFALVLRSVLLQGFWNEGVLEDRVQDGELAPIVFEVAARWELTLAKADSGEFLKQLRASSL